MQSFLYMGKQELVNSKGKTHTMGTINQVNENSKGIIPQTINQLFN